MLGYEKGIQGETATLSLILSLFVPILPPILMQSKLNSVIMADSVSPAVATAMQYAAKPVDNGYNGLEKQKELYDKGVITGEEFTEKKKQVLGIWRPNAHTVFAVFICIRTQKLPANTAGSSHLLYYPVTLSLKQPQPCECRFQIRG